MPAHVATTARGAEPALVAELAHHGIDATATGRGAVRFEGDLEQAYRVCLWSRVASRVLAPLGTVPAHDADALLVGIRGLDWGAHLPEGATFAVHGVGRNAALRNSHFIALRTKDGIVDRLRADRGHRPDVDPDAPDLRVSVHVDGAHAEVAIDLSGEALHRRGGRDGGPAPLRETLAAAILWMGDWPTLAARGVPLVDPLCGSGTFLREAAGLALDRAPGLVRDRFGFHGWLGHDPGLWGRLVDEARARRDRPVPPPLLGADRDPAQIARTRRNLERDDLTHVVRTARRPWDRLEPPPGAADTPRGLLVANPPYGERLGELREARALVRSLGDRLRRHWLGWRALLLVGSVDLAKNLGLRPSRRIPLRNGPLDARVLDLQISTEPVARDR